MSPEGPLGAAWLYPAWPAPSVSRSGPPSLPRTSSPLPSHAGCLRVAGCPLPAGVSGPAVPRIPSICLVPSTAGFPSTGCDHRSRDWTLNLCLGEASKIHENPKSAVRSALMFIQDMASFWDAHNPSGDAHNPRPPVGREVGGPFGLGPRLLGGAVCALEGVPCNWASAGASREGSRLGRPAGPGSGPSAGGTQGPRSACMKLGLPRASGPPSFPGPS